MEEEVLDTLRARRGSFVSGEELSRLAGVTRAAIWKEVQKLREQGYRILAQPHAGYQLLSIPDRMIPQELTWNLRTRRIARRVYAYESTGSTMDVAHRLASAGEPEGTVVVAEAQAQGRGRLGRRWLSPKGKGIYLSVILRPPLPLSSVAHVTLMAAVAAARAIQSSAASHPQIKWPNDILLGGRKVGGILTELHAELNRIHFVTVGIGLNVRAFAHLPAYASSLDQETGGRVNRLGLARALLLELDRAYDTLLTQGIAPILEAWRGFAEFLGRRIRVALQNRVVDGQAMDVDSNGALLVRTDTGIVEPVSAGDVLIVR